MTSSYLKALLKLSGDEDFADARMRLIDGLNWEELEIVAVEGITGCTNRKVRERLVCAMLNILKENPNIEPMTVPKTESLGFVPIAPRIDATQVKAATPSVAKRKRAIQDTNSERQEPASKAFKNEPIGGSSLDTIDLRDDENDDKNEDDYESDMWEADNVIHPYDYRPAILPTVIDLEDSVKDEEESNTVAPEMVLYADQNPATDPQQPIQIPDSG
ncbi:uncharacterized protein J4E79_009985 [Alternaria viburni]|uniref:uncharacterized protein n=1 Tax=Alternaria viburni TaxID=566460 RepID=UPI0020C58364|nr:uncharacterized protein J4E79_009985 [Alternaria viburni]KAI4648363.1 hypothetical protein J4E79_009985 [Alternaria viburni]